MYSMYCYLWIILQEQKQFADSARTWNVRNWVRDGSCCLCVCSLEDIGIAVQCILTKWRHLHQQWIKQILCSVGVQWGWLWAPTSIKHFRQNNFNSQYMNRHILKQINIKMFMLYIKINKKQVNSQNTVHHNILCWWCVKPPVQLVCRYMSYIYAWTWARGGLVHCWPSPPGAVAQSSVMCLWLISDPKDLACWILILGEDSSTQSEKRLFVCCVYTIHKKCLHKSINIYNIMMNLPWSEAYWVALPVLWNKHL
jgi:hypothetical protein